ncbi:MAG: 23S rRNA (adenine(2503)-C(2))-methyltransferase RlmN [Acidobacteria bacterium]|nr:23S rRNA (adenine(2503)-C(2))-methyltransferase RlmN [Acidobacteriota bacterium]
MKRNPASTRRAEPSAPRRPSLIGRSLEEIEATLASLGEPAYRGRQIYSWIYARRALTFDEMTNIPASLRARLAGSFDIGRAAVARVEASADGTRKFLLQVQGARVEAVYIPEPRRITFCLSSQAGCALDCSFCLTAKLGLVRHLKAGEIVSQALQLLDERGDDPRPVNVVFMGMGEPLHNYDEVMKAFRVLAGAGGVGISAKRITLSTAGMVPAIRRLAAEALRPKLAISLNATTDEIRSRIMPINRKHPIDELLAATAEFPLAPRERVTFEYVMLDGINATLDDAARLAALVRKHRLRAKVNLIPWNPGEGFEYRAPDMGLVKEFRDTLIEAGVPCSIRKNRGRDISAACGQLALVEHVAPEAAR